MKNSSINLAIVSPSVDIYSETFIQMHRQIKADKVFFYYNGRIPTYLDGEGVMNFTLEEKKLKTLIRLGFKINPITILFKRQSLKQHLFYQSLKKHNINVVLAEYGPTGVACMDICEQLGIPLITHFHGFDISRYDIQEEYLEKYKILMKKSAYIVGVSRLMCKKILELGAAPEKIVYTPCGPNDLFSKHCSEAENKNFISVGRFVDKKAPYYSIIAFSEVVKKYPDARLRMIGTGPLWDTCKNIIDVLNLQHNVELLGVLKPNEIKKLHDDSIGFIQHSLTPSDGDMEGTPVGVMEASASGLPVISTFHAGIPDVIIDGETGLLCHEHDYKKMSNDIIWVIEHPNEARDMGRKGHNYVVQNFSINHHLSKLSDTVKSAVSKLN